MIFKKISDIKSSEFQDVWEIYESSFPPDERRDFRKQVELLHNSSERDAECVEWRTARYKAYILLGVYNRDQLIGFVESWNLGSFTFIEHFAVCPDFRGKGFGTKILKEYITRIIGQNTKEVVLEVEKPETGNVASRRIKFYERLDFNLNRYEYIQPSYGGRKRPVSLFLMTYPKEISELEFTTIRRKIHKVVYGVKRAN